MRIIFSLLFLSIITPSIAQENKQSAFSFNYNYQIPNGTIAERYGNSSAVGISYFIEKENNIFYGISGDYIFGNNVNDSSIFINITTSTGSIISSDGNFANVILQERGINSHLFVGYAFHTSDNNLSGIYLSAGLGYMQHKIFLSTKGQNIPQLNEEYKKGYDRSTSGISTKLAAEYKYYSKKGNMQFTGGLNFNLAYTSNDRPYNFDTKQHTSAAKNTEQKFGISIGMIIPISRKNEEEFHYY
mgnify:CR=1 FL=1